jgi:hypothetical protein
MELPLATDAEIARAISAYRLAGDAIDDPFTLAAALLLDIDSCPSHNCQIFSVRPAAK